MKKYLSSLLIPLILSFGIEAADANNNNCTFKYPDKNGIVQKLQKITLEKKGDKFIYTPLLDKVNYIKNKKVKNVILKTDLSYLEITKKVFYRGNNEVNCTNSDICIIAKAIREVNIQLNSNELSKDCFGGGKIKIDEKSTKQYLVIVPKKLEYIGLYDSKPKVPYEYAIRRF